MLLVILLSFVLAAAENVTDITVSMDTCFDSMVIDSMMSVRLKYTFDFSVNGNCWFRFKNNGYRKQVCIDLEKYVVPKHCGIELQYREWEPDSEPEMMYDCQYNPEADTTKQTWCSEKNIIYVTFKRKSEKRSKTGGSAILLKVYRAAPDSDGQNYYERNKFKIIGIVGGLCVVFLIIGVVSVVCCRTNKMERRRSYQSSDRSQPVNAQFSSRSSQQCQTTEHFETGPIVQFQGPQRYHVGDEPPSYSEVIKESMEEPPPPYPGK